MVEQNGNLFLWISMVGWLVVYLVGKHPDVCWGDGMGYSLAIQSGFDWATNANSHFLYLNFHRLLMEIFGFDSSIQVLGWASVFWAIATLAVVFQLGKIWGGFSAGLVAIHVLASSFSFWRHASIIEVYTMSACFWAICLLALMNWNSGKWPAWIFFLVHSLGLLVHIQLVLLFPVLLWVLWKKRVFPIAAMLFYGLPLLVIFWSVFVLKTNDLPSVLFDNVGGKMVDNLPFRLLKGLIFIPAYGFFLLAGPILYAIWFARNQVKSMPFNFSFNAQIVLISSGINLAFCLFFPEPGIHVFLIPSFLGFGLMVGKLVSAYNPGQTVPAVIFIPVFQVVFYLSLNVFIQHFSLFPANEETDWKGGPAYYLLPWAKGNATSVLDSEVASKLKTPPAGLMWNIDQASAWKKGQ